MKKYWFKRKKFGYGWQPASIEGWTVIILYLAALIHFSFKYSTTNSAKFLGSIIILTGLCIFISYLKGEKPKWPWSKKTK